ncbi:MAG: hypothetical protein HKN73_14470 [Gemmatimonadetes bacterium]|nr:hypothetical protein [Gemmatimonadota bacterium]
MTRSRFPVFSRAAALGLFFLIAGACGDDGPAGPGDDGFTANFTASVTGDVNTSIAGTAVFSTGTDPETGESAWVMYMTTGADANQAFSSGENVAFFGLGAPEERAYVLEDITASEEFPDGGAAGWVLLFDGQTISGIFGSTGGTLTITSLSANRMDGTFTVTATGTIFDGQEATEGTVTVQGSFQATSGLFLVPFGG